MKKLICLALLLNACNDSDDKIEGKPPTPTAPTVVIEAPPVPETPSNGFIIPPKRSFLYECNRQSKAKETGPSYSAFVELMSDGSRQYHINIFDGGVNESFVAVESKNSALPFTPIDDAPGTYQGSDVYHDMLEMSQLRYNLSFDAHYQLNLKNDQDGRLVLTLSAVDEGKVIDIGGGVSYCEISE